MEIIETESFIIIEKAPVEFGMAIPLIPFELVWFEITAKDSIFEGLSYPVSTEAIKNFDIKEIVDLEELEEEGFPFDIELKFYFIKNH